METPEIPQTGGTFIRDPETGALTRVTDHTAEEASVPAAESSEGASTSTAEDDTIVEPPAPTDPPADPPGEDAPVTTRKRLK